MKDTINQKVLEAANKENKRKGGKIYLSLIKKKN